MFHSQKDITAILLDFSRVLFESRATSVIRHLFSATALAVLTAHSIPSVRFHVSGLGGAFQLYIRSCR